MFLPFINDLATLRFEQAGNGAQRGVLPAPLRADERDDVALLDLQRNAMQRGDRAVVHL